MNTVIFSRDLLAHCMIIAAVVVGGWIMFVQPQAQELAELESAIAETHSGDVPLTQDGIEALAARVERVRNRVVDVQSRNKLAHDSSQLYGAVMELGERHGVLIERLRPGTDQRKVANGKATATRVDITVRGPYESVARFLDDVLTLPGFMRPVSLSVNPTTDTTGGVAARLVCEALHFDLPEQLAFTDGGAADVDS